MSHPRRSFLSFMVLVLLMSYGAKGYGHEHNKGKVDQSLRRAPSFILIDQNGRKFRLEGLKKGALITFLYTSCTATCPVQTAKLLEIQKALGDKVGKEIFFIAITVDPKRDKPEVLRRFAAKWGVNSPAWTFLTGSPEEIAQVAKAYGVFYRMLPDGEIEHSALFFLIDRKGMIRKTYGSMAGPDEMVRDIQALIARD